MRLLHISDLSPEDVFLRACEQAGESVDDGLIVAFRELLHEASSAASATSADTATARPGAARQREPLLREESRP